jgi:hypothetical protein
MGCCTGRRVLVARAFSGEPTEYSALQYKYYYIEVFQLPRRPCLGAFFCETKIDRWAGDGMLAAGKDGGSGAQSVDEERPRAWANKLSAGMDQEDPWAKQKTMSCLYMSVQVDRHVRSTG